MRSRRIQFVVLCLLVLLHPGSGAIYSSLDSYFWVAWNRLSPDLQAKSQLSRVLLVMLDELDLQEVKDTWPWNRREIASLLEVLEQAGVAGVGISLDLQLEYLRKRDPAQDQVLRAAFERAGTLVYLGAGPGGAQERVVRQPDEFFRPVLDGWGQAELWQDRRGHLTHLGLVSPGGDRSPLQALQSLLRAAGDEDAAIQLEVNLNEEGRIPLPFHLTGVLPHVTLRALRNGGVPRKLLEDRVILFGASAIVLHDLYDTPVESNMPSVKALGLVLEGAFRDQLLWEPPTLLDALLMILTCSLVVLGARRSTPLQLVGALVGGSVLWLSGTIFFRGVSGLALPISRPLGLAALTVLLEVLRQRSEVHSSFMITDPLVEREARRMLDGAMSAMARGDYETALKEFAEVAVMETVLRARAEHRLVLALLAMNRLVEAEVLVGSLDFEKLTEEEIYLLAKELESRDLGKEARKVFEKLYLIDPDFQDVRARLAELRHQLSGFSEDELVETIARRILDRRYVDAHLFNKGGGGFLFRVKDRLRSGEELALKILSPLQMNDPMVVRRFLREARTVGALDHPNLIRVYDVFEASLPYYTMEFVEACSVMELMQSVGPMDPARVGRLVAQACRGLQHAHEHGLIHRDVKPHNLLVGNGDQVKVIDFGVARVMGSAESLASGQISGTPLYMSPEQARGDATGPESDLYSLGLVLFEMLYGRLPYQTMQARLVDAVPRPATNSSIPDLLVEVMMTALRTEPEARFSSMKEMEQALIKAISHGSQESSGVPPIPSGR